MSATNFQDNGSQPNCVEPKFPTAQDEIAYLRIKLDESQIEFQEFQESSRELETEYETQIKQLEIRNSEALNQVSRLQDENEQLKSRYNAHTSDTQHKLNEYQQQIGDLTALNNRLTTYIRELEQNNDDLERAQRALAASLEDFEAQLNQQIERNVLLENEVSEKEELECVVQRLKEEARDLRHELIVNKNTNQSARGKQLIIDNLKLQSPSASLQPISPKLDSSNSIEIVENNMESLSLNGTTSSIDATSQTSPIRANGIPTPPIDKRPNIDSTTSPMTTQTQTPSSTPSKFSFSSPFSYGKSSPTRSADSRSQQTSTPSSPTMPSIVMSPSSRISALNIVSDLLRKVGALESKLASAKKVTG